MNTGEQHAQVPSGGLNIQVLKEPRGLIRILQWIFAIFAFSTTAGFWTEIKFAINSNSDCKSIIVEYPFRLGQIEGPCKSYFNLVGDMSTQSEYFVTVGVLSFLYCMGILVVYFLFEAMYQSNVLLPIIDLGFTGIFALFWLTASSAWAQGVSDVKYYADPDVFLKESISCKDPNSCHTISEGSYATLNVSLIFGFANFALWAASLWFIYKETAWFKKREANAMEGSPTYDILTKNTDILKALVALSAAHLVA
ncbi:hypothetical protein CHUAL_002254 [Chamberlinius hualienensis]